MSGSNKGKGRTSGLRVNKAAAPKTGTKLTQKRIANHLRSLNRSSRNGSAGNP